MHDSTAFSEYQEPFVLFLKKCLRSRDEDVKISFLTAQNLEGRFASSIILSAIKLDIQKLVEDSGMMTLSLSKQHPFPGVL